MLEGNRAPTHQEVRHVDRCLSCLSCMTTCPSGVNYMHLVDHGRHHIEDTYTRPLPDRLLRRLLGVLMPRPRLFRWVTVLGWLAKPLAAALPARSSDPGGATFLRRIKAMIDAIPAVIPDASPVDRPQTFPAVGQRVRRVALMPGCGQQVLAPEVNEATVRLLTRHGVEVVNVAGSGCCGSSVQHIGDNRQALELARRNIDAWLEAGVRRHRDQRLGLRHDGQGLRPHVRRRSGLEGQGRARVQAREGCQRAHDGGRSRERDRAAAHRRLSFGMFHAARPEGESSSPGSCCAMRASS